MRKITKYVQPAELKDWRKLARGSGINYTFEGMRSDAPVKQAFINELLNEQYVLCAYTGIRIDIASCHFEHLKAQDFCVNGEDTEYRNLVACYPNTGKCEFGAFAKENWPDHNKPAEVRLFISPLHKQCETSFEYEETGRISVKKGLSQSQSNAAQTTITKLCLGHDELIARRKGAINGALRPRGRVLTAQDAQTILSKVDRPKNGELREFSFVIKQALERYLQSLTN